MFATSRQQNIVQDNYLPDHNIGCINQYIFWYQIFFHFSKEIDRFFFSSAVQHIGLTTSPVKLSPSKFYSGSSRVVKFLKQRKGMSGCHHTE